MRELNRREFLWLVGAGGAAAYVAAACGGDDDDGGGAATATSLPAATDPTASAASPTVSAGTDAGAAGLRWYGQSMFLLTSPGGTELLLDPFGNIGYTLPPPIGADVVTVTHEHPDHNNDALAAAGATVLRGLTADGWADIDQMAGDVRVRTVQAYHDDRQGAALGRNAIFVFETGGLRIAHLGDLGHQLDAAQTQALGGPVDVLMVPVGGGFTIDPAGATELTRALAPKLVFPMHYRTERAMFTPATVDEFLEGKTFERAGSTTMRIAKDALPAEQTVVVLDYE